MVKIKFQQLCEQHRFTIQMIHESTGLSRNTLTALYYSRTQRIDINTIDSLCRYFNQFFPCKIGDILEYADK